MQIFPQIVTSNAASDVPPQIPNSQGEDKKNQKGEIKDEKKNDKVKNAAKESKKEKSGTEKSQPASSSSIIPSQLDIKVGHIVNCTNHPESEKLLCEEIDLGEGTNRTIGNLRH